MVLIALYSALSGGERCSDMALFGRLKRSFLEVPDVGARHPEDLKERKDYKKRLFLIS
ncbi:MAG: hypothetical protein IPK66_06050 [Rhodospirillales bacterium]|nr:hypothetical protein [Rhodospirillales bacterium]